MRVRQRSLDGYIERIMVKIYIFETFTCALPYTKNNEITTIIINTGSTGSRTHGRHNCSCCGIVEPETNEIANEKIANAKKNDCVYGLTAWRAYTEVNACQSKNENDANDRFGVWGTLVWRLRTTKKKQPKKEIKQQPRRNALGRTVSAPAIALHWKSGGIGFLIIHNGPPKIPCRRYMHSNKCIWAFTSRACHRSWSLTTVKSAEREIHRPKLRNEIVCVCVGAAYFLTANVPTTGNMLKLKLIALCPSLRARDKALVTRYAFKIQ